MDPITTTTQESPAVDTPIAPENDTPQFSGSPADDLPVDKNQSEGTETSSGAVKDGIDKAENLPRATKEHIELVMKELELPKGTEYIIDKNNKLKFIMAIDGKKYAFEPSEVFKGFNINQAGYKRLAEADQREANIAAYLQKFIEEPDELLNFGGKIGISQEKLERAAANYIKRALENAQKTPEQLQLEKERAEIENWKKQKEADEKTKAEQERLSVIKKQQETITSEIIGAMKKAGFNAQSKSPHTLKGIMASALAKMSYANDIGKKLSADDALVFAKQEWQAYTKDVFSEVDDQHIVDLIDPRIVKAIRKADLSRFSDIPTSNHGEIGQRVDLSDKEIKDIRTRGSNKQQKEKVSISDFFRNLSN